MHQLIDKKNKIVIYLILLIILSTTTNKLADKQKNFSTSINKIDVVGLSKNENLKILNKLNNLFYRNILILNREVIDKIISKHNIVEEYDVKKIYPSNLLIKIKPTKFIAKISGNSQLVVGANGKLIRNINDKITLPYFFGEFNSVEFLKFNDGIYTVASSSFGSGAADPTLSGTETGGVTGGATNGESALNVSGMTLNDIGIKTQEEAQAAILILDKSLQDISTGRAKLGAVSNRLSHNLDNQTQASMMTQTARGRVVDTDMAIESTKLAQEQILSQAAQQAINMATARQQTVLVLLET